SHSPPGTASNPHRPGGAVLLRSSFCQDSKAAVLAGQSHQQRRGLPVPGPKLVTEATDLVMNVRQTNPVGIVHGPAPRPWKAVAVDVYDVDIPGSLRDPFLQYPRAFIDQGVDEAGQDFAILDFAADNTQAAGMFLDQCVHRRVRKGSPVLLIVAVI